MKYYALFDDNGNRITTYVEGIHKTIPSGVIEITEGEQNLYATNQYTRDMETGKLVLKPPHVSTMDEEIVELDIEYQPQFAELVNSLGTATLAGNSDLIASIKSDYAALKTEYDTKRGEIDG